MRRQRLRHALFGSLALGVVAATAAPALAQDEPQEVEVPADQVADEVAELDATAAAQDEQELAEQLLEEYGPGVITQAALELAHANDASHATEDCIAPMLGGAEMDDCWDAPSPLLPETNEIIWGAVGFGIVFFVLAKFGFPAMKAGMNARTERIRNDLQMAEDQRGEAETLLAEYRAQLNDARTEAGRIIDEARQTAEQLKRDQERALQAELAEQRERAVSDIDAQKAQATDELRDDLARLAIGAAEAVVQRNLDAETQTQLVEDYINQVATSRS